ncbi:hypothetical protein FJZ31_19275 [Candidatus Poribacteria bacterium]|nr:hypothetical protein [Candidatus Poribacteria bacterium]
MKISLILLFFIYMTTVISYASGKQTDATIITENTATENLTTKKTESNDKADKSKSENANEKSTMETPRKKNILWCFFSAVKMIFGKSGIQNANAHTEDHKSSQDLSHELNYDYFVDKDDDGICDGRDIKQPRRQQMGNRKGWRKN